MVELNLQMFADGAGGDGGAAGAAPAGPGPQATSPGDMEAAAALEKLRQKRQQKGRPPHVEYIRESEAQAAGQQPATAEQAQQGESYEDLIKGRYKDDNDRQIQSIVQARIKNIKQAEEALEKIRPALEILARQKGKDPSDIDGLVKSITEDDSLYEEEALEKGLPVQTLKQMKTLERDAETMRQQLEQQRQRSQVEAHLQKLVQQADAAKQLYPQIDLRSELQNPEFVRLTSPSVGIDVRTAYEVVHRDTLQPAIMQYAAQKSAEKLSNAVRSGSNRPSENGLKTNPNAVVISDNPRQWPKEYLKKIRDEVMRGASIRLP